MRNIDFEVISVPENSNKFQKIKFWKEKSVNDVVTLGPTAQATLVDPRNKVVCFVTMRSTKLGCFRFCSWYLWKALDEEGCISLVS